AIFFSSTSLFTRLEASTRSARLMAEEAITASKLAYTILRPTMIYGSSRDRNIARLIGFLQRSPVVPIPGDGKASMQPVYVHDLARAVVDCIEAQATIGKAYNLSGARPLSFNDLIDQTCDALELRRLKIHVPLSLSIAAVRLMNRVQRRLKVN